MATMKSLTIRGKTYDTFGANVTVLPGAFFDARPINNTALTKTQTDIPMQEIAQYGDYFAIVDGAITCLKSCMVEASYQFYNTGCSSGDRITTAVQCAIDSTKTLFCVHIVRDYNGHTCVSGTRCIPFYVGDVAKFVASNDTADRGSIANWNESNTFVHLRVLYDLPDAE